MNNTPALFSPPSNNPTKPRKATSMIAADVEDRVLVLEVKQEHQIERVDDMEQDIQSLKEAVLGTKDEPGISPRLRRLEEYISDIKRLAWAILLLLLGIVVSQFYNILIIHPTP